MIPAKLSFSFDATQEIIKKIALIDSFKGKWKAIEGKESRYLKELKQIATVQSIGSSTRIEGATMTDAEVAELLKAVQITKFKNRDEEEVYGYYEVLHLISSTYHEIELKENHVHHLHKLLLGKSGKDESHRGAYKKLSNKVVANYPDGQQKVIFNTTPPFLVTEEMSDLFKWTNKNIQEETIHPLIAIATFTYEFLSIHPYQDGNGRLSRLLTTLLLLKSDYDFMEYASMEIEIESQKKAYYNSLMAGQKNRGTAKENIEEWMLFFLNTLVTTIQKLEQRFEFIQQKKKYLNERQEKIVGFIKEQEPVKISDVVNAFSEYTSYSLKKDIAYLVKEGLIRKEGKARATIYYWNAFA